MAKVKSFSFPDGDIRGDLFYINHNVDCFTIIDCYLRNNDERTESIINEIVKESKDKYIKRFISTHPDDDHIHGIEKLWEKWNTTNFYAVANEFPVDKDNKSLAKYIELRDNTNTPICKDLPRAFLNRQGTTKEGRVIKGSGIHFLWPDTNNEDFKSALELVKKGEGPNNICPVIKYSISDGPSFLWMGDMETDMQRIFYEVEKDNIGHIDIVFAPHHGRESGSIPRELLDALSPQIVVIGNAPSDKLKYLESDLTITQNASGDILFDIDGKKVRVYTQHKYENKPKCLKYDLYDALSNIRMIGEKAVSANSLIYLGTLTIK